LNIRSIIVPPFAGNFSAWGLLGSDLVRSSARTQLFTLVPGSLERIDTAIGAMFAELQSRGEDRGFLEQGVRELGLGMRFTGQEHSLTIPVPWKDGKMSLSGAQLEQAFRDAYLKTFGITLDNTVEVIVLRTAIRKALSRTILRPGANAPHSQETLPTQEVYSFAQERELTATTVMRSSLQVGVRHPGPAILYEDTTTTYVDADFSYGLDSNGCVVLTREG
jgi:N-methylhydantoinase A